MVNRKFISSSQNTIIKSLKLLQTKKSERKKQQVFIMEGIRSIEEIPAHYKIKELIISEQFDESSYEFKEDIPVLMVTEEIFKSISDTQSPQGIMAVVEMQPVALTDIKGKSDGFYLLLEQLQDPGNLGTIIRTAYGFGVDAIFLTKGCVDVYSPKVVRSTMGAMLNVPIVEGLEVDECAQWAKQQGLKVYTTALDDTACELAQANLGNGIMLAIGNEGNGVTAELLRLSDEKIYIPMPGGLESLNASIAASICMYEVMSQRRG